MNDTVRYQLDGHVATITYHRPERLNAIDGAMRRGLNEAANAVLAEPAFARYLEGEGAIPSPMPAEAFAEFLRAEVATMRQVVTAARIRAD